jgi:gamma-glutamyltranspeptidase/glutathione hydrolase
MVRTTVTMTASELAVKDALVAAEHPLAVDAGIAMLQEGGNAVDAAIAAGFVMGVTHPAGSGLGGGGIMVIAGPGRDPVVVDFAPVAPRAASCDTFPTDDGPSGRFGWRHVKDDANIVGHRAAAVPGQVRGLAAASERFGALPLAAAVVPAIAAARDGFTADGRFLVQLLRSSRKLSRFPGSRGAFLPGGFPLGLAPMLVTGPAVAAQPDLAAVLASIAADGPDGFYQGWVADAIVADMDANGGLIGHRDLAEYQAAVRPAQLVRYRGLDVAGAPGPCGCFTAQQSLLALEAACAEPGALELVDYLHLSAEVFRRAFADRRAYGADETQVPVPYAGLLSRGYASERVADIDPARAARQVSAGDPWPFEPKRARGHDVGTSRSSAGSSTTHICVVDRDGLTVSLTQTLADSFGCGVTVPGTGILLNNAMQWLDPEPGHPNSVGPAKHGMNNMTPLIVARGDRPILTVGSPGGARIINAVTQIVSHVVDRGMGVQDAVEGPRIDCSTPALLADSRLPAEVVAELGQRGQQVQVVTQSWDEVHFSRPLAVLVDDAGVLRSGIDPYHGAVAGGY